MASDPENKDIAGKLACYERVVEIIKDRLALEDHLRDREASAQEILFAREDAYCNIVEAVLGPDALSMITPAKATPLRRRNPSKKPGRSKARGSSRKALPRTRRVPQRAAIGRDNLKSP